MSYNGSGTFQINSTGQPVVTGTVISSSAFNALTADLATGLSTAITKDGQTATTVRIPFAAGINSSLTTDTSSGSTGSIFTAGGVGIAKALYVGTNATVAGALGVTGVTTVQAGTAAAPAITTSGDTNTGIFFPAADTIAFTEGGAESMRIDSSGNVGIGTASPAYKLDVAGVISTNNNLTFTGTGNRITGDFSTTTFANRVAFQTSTVNGATQVTILPNGTSTTGTLQVYNNSDPTNAFRGTLASISDSLRLSAEITGTGTYLPMVFSTGGSERVRIDTSGNVGIGTSSPSQKLDVVGAAQISFSSGVNTYQYFQSTSNYVGRATDGNFWVNVAGGQNILFGVGASEKVRIDSSGIVTMNAYGAGAATFSAAGVISSVSDETWKIKDGIPVDTDSMLKKLEPGYWYYNDEKKETFGTDRQLGFYAQNVNAAIGPEAAPIPEEGKPWGYYDRSVLAVTVMSLQKALATIESLTARIAALESN